ncbi:MAG: hypothetical protein ACKVW3_17890 [Phycisphaerales bacterium]
MDSRTEMTATVARISRRFRRAPSVSESVAEVRYRLAGTPARLKRFKRAGMIGGPVLLLAAGVAAWLILRPVPQPDYLSDDIGEVFNYTLLTEEFNKLPIEKRMELIGQLVSRMKTMSAGDSVLMAAFASGVAGAARKQIEENASKLMIDLWDKYAKEYANVKPEDQGAFLDNTFLEFVKTMEGVAGQARDVPDSERLTEVREQAARERERAGQGRTPPNQALGRMFTIMRDNVGGHASPAQRTRGQLMIRDMMRHFRGEGGGGK